MFTGIGKSNRVYFIGVLSEPEEALAILSFGHADRIGSSAAGN